MHDDTLVHRDFDSFAALAAQRPVLDALVALYIESFGEGSVWGEAYSRADVLRKLRSELAGCAALRLVLAPGGEVAAFCWAQAMRADDVARAVGTIQYAQASMSDGLGPSLAAALGDAPVLYVHDLAIAERYRGRVGMTRLVYPLLGGLGLRSGIDRVLFWSIADTQMALFARRASFVPVLTVGPLCFHLGRFAVTDRDGLLAVAWHRPADATPQVAGSPHRAAPLDGGATPTRGEFDSLAPRA
ncbi:MAG: hypothetical protein JSR18_16810 [Proteobacteria bacterium]|nr:hypothetical protein [Pseudomonadota bacterium]